MRILIVCLGNICRSPAAEGVLRAIAAREAPDLGLVVDSAGTADYHVGEPPDRRMLAVARGRGYDLSELRARQVEREDFRRFDLLLAMDESNLADLETMAPHDTRARRRLFMEFAPEHGLASVPDPYYGTVRDFETVIDLVESGARGLIAALRRSSV
jgi:protein-tyrosine phosphatase